MSKAKKEILKKELVFTIEYGVNPEDIQDIERCLDAFRETGWCHVVDVRIEDKKVLKV